MQVDRGFANDSIDQPGVQAHAELKKQLLDDVGTGSSFAWRHRQRLQRSRGKSAWRPQTRYRVGARKVAEIGDNHTRVSTPFGGLAYLKENALLPRWQKAALWPGMGWPLDQDSENVP